MTSRPEGGGVHDDLTEVSIDFGCSRRIQEHVADMVHACPNRKVAVGVLEVIRHACFVRCFVFLVSVRPNVRGVLDEGHRHPFGSQMRDPALVGIDVRVAEPVQKDGQWNMGDRRIIREFGERDVNAPLHVVFEVTLNCHHLFRKFERESVLFHGVRPGEGAVAHGRCIGRCGRVSDDGRDAGHHQPCRKKDAHHVDDPRGGHTLFSRIAQRRRPTKGNQKACQRPAHEGRKEKKGPSKVEHIHQEMKADEAEKKSQTAVRKKQPWSLTLAFGHGRSQTVSCEASPNKECQRQDW